MIDYGAKIGIHAIQGAKAIQYTQEAINRGFYIPVVKAVDDVGWLRDIKNISPNTIIIARFTSEWEGCQGVESMNMQQLNELADRLMTIIEDKMALNPGLPVDYWEVVNEPDPPSGYSQLSQLMILCMERANHLGIKLAIFGLNAGTPEYSDMIQMVESGVFAFAKANGHILTLHEGVLEPDWPINQWWGHQIPGSPVVDGAGALCFRYRYLYDLMGADKIPLVVSEMYYQAYDNPDEVASRAAWYDAEASKDWWFMASLPFTVGPVGQWVNQNYEPSYPAILNYMDSVKNRENAVSPEYPPVVPVLPNILNNHSFEGGYYHLYVDDNGRYYLPWTRPTNIPTYAVPELQVPNDWELWWREGYNELNPEYPWLRPETRVMPADQLPPHERPLFVRDGNWTVKLFKGSGAMSWGLRTTMNLEPGKEYEFVARIYPDLVVSYNPDGSKVFAQDRPGSVRLTIAGEVGEWEEVVAGDWLEYRRTFTVNSTITQRARGLIGMSSMTSVDISVEARCRWALSNNGWFIDEWELREIAPAPEPNPCTRDYRVQYFLTPSILTDSQRNIIIDWVYNGLSFSNLTTSGKHVWSYSHLDAIESVIQGAAGSFLFIVNPQDIGTGITPEWLMINFPDIVDNTWFVYTDGRQPIKLS